MKTKLQRKSGMTLLIVVLSLGLVMLLVVGYLAGVTSNIGNSDAYASTLNVQEVANSAMQLALSQIKAGTSNGTTVAWASQPGAIRTYDNAGNALAVYKLFSSSQMVYAIGSGGTPYNPQNDWAPSTWQTTPGLYTDINEPVEPNGQEIYPIFDPAAAAIQSNGSPLVDGCSINSTSPSPVAGASNSAAMPVQWIYELRDGTMVVPTVASGSVTTIPNATSSNPPVARFAFWTDDETCKLNVNTASEGSYWDTPMMAAPSELYFGRYQPAQNEFQRYPGHPASTCLSPVLWSLWGLPGPESSLQPALNPTLSGSSFSIENDTNPTLSATVTTYFQDLFGILPKLVWGGSDMGTQATALNYNSTASAVSAISIASATLDADRLFASTDEFLFARPTSSTPPRTLNYSALTPSVMEQFRFFLTANSKAPDVNMFNQPKICIWPENDTTKNNPSNGWNTGKTVRSPVDQLIAFCSTINGNPYYFTRCDPNNPSGDFTTRNQTLYNYLTAAMATPIPGFGAAFSSRYTSGQSNQIITEIYDYIRSAINLFDTSDAILGGASSNIYAFAPGIKSLAAGGNGYLGTAQVLPFQHPSNGTQGNGRYVTVKQAVVWFIVKAANQPPVMVNASGQPVDSSGNVITSTSQSFVVNPLHPWTGAPPTTLPAPSFTTATPPVLKDPFNPDPPTGTINQYNVYPTLSNTALTGTQTQSPVLYNGTGTLMSTLVTSASQTHAGMPYLTMLDWSNGLYDLPNPRYQGPPAQTSGPLPTLPYHSTQIQAVFFLDLVNNSVGFVGSVPNYAYEVTGLNAFQVNGTSLNFPSDATHVAESSPAYYGIGQEQYAINGPPQLARVTGGTEGNLNSPLLTFVSSPVIVSNTSATSPTFSFTGGTITFKIKPASGATVGTGTIQTGSITFPNGTFPTPLLPPASPTVLLSTGIVHYPPKSTDDLVPSSLLTVDCGDQLGTNPNAGTTTSSSTLYTSPCSRLVYSSGGSIPEGQIFLPQVGSDSLGSATSISSELQKLTCDTIRSVEFEYGDTRLEACMPTVSASFFVPHEDYNSTTVRPAHSLRGAYGNTETVQRGGTQQPLTNATLTFATPTTAYIASAWGTGSSTTTQERPGVPAYAFNVSAASQFPHTTSTTDFSTTAFQTIWANGGDFDNANAELSDGPFINKPDEGTSLWNSGSYLNAYFNSYDMAHAAIGSTLFSANRQVPSPVIFGSLPAGFDPNNPSLSTSWTTLLFCPNPNSQTHVGLGANPPDYALLDFFHMPVVQPYAISEPLSTAGMVNMNYQIVPFSYIKRDTALRGVMKSVMLTAIPDSAIYYYKGNAITFGDSGGTQDKASKASGYWNYRYPIALTPTLEQFDAKFATNDIFRSPSQICSLWLYPGTQPTASAPNNPATSLVTYDSANANISNWWYSGSGTTRKSLTGTNLRDRPYALIYPRLTTKSNTFTVHVRAQLLRVPTGSGATLDETTSRTIGEWRGSFLVERYIDPNNTSLPDFAASANSTAAVDPYYTFRTIATRRFSP